MEIKTYMLQKIFQNFYRKNDWKKEKFEIFNKFLSIRGTRAIYKIVRNNSQKVLLLKKKKKKR